MMNEHDYDVMAQLLASKLTDAEFVRLNELMFQDTGLYLDRAVSQLAEQRYPQLVAAVKAAAAQEPDAVTNEVDLDVEDVITDLATLLSGRTLDQTKETARVNHTRGDRMVSFLVHLVHQEDAGPLIGKKGHTIKAIREILMAIGGAHRRIYQLDLEDDGGRRHERAEGEQGQQR
jgi:predicted RNA-binding protein YlqC (UPF0109 family)